MFSGIVRSTAVVVYCKPIGEIYELVLEFSELTSDLRIGDSIAINGACLTLKKHQKLVCFFDIIVETLLKTSLSDLSAGNIVNIEYPLKLTDFLSGHLVSGHIDFVSKLICRHDNNRFEFDFPGSFQKFIVEKGSITLNGVSLTLCNCSVDSFSVNLIPETLKVTNFRNLRIGDNVNVEVDMIAKYLENLIKK